MWEHSMKTAYGSVILGHTDLYWQFLEAFLKFISLNELYFFVGKLALIVKYLSIEIIPWLKFKFLELFWAHVLSKGVCIFFLNFPSYF
jgi:hypothetical protein